MTEHDVLDRAAQALRAANTGEHQGSGFTRARIMTSLHQNRRGRLYRWAIGAPLASVLLVGSAWAQSTGKWPVVWAAVSAVFTAEQEPSEPGGGVRTSETRAPQRSAPSPVVNEPEPAPPAEPAPTLVQDAVQQAPIASERSTLRRPPQRASAPKAARESSSKPIETAPRKNSGARRAPRTPRGPRARSLSRSPRAPLPGQSTRACHRSLRRIPAASSHAAASCPRRATTWRSTTSSSATKREHGEELRPFADGAYGDYRKREAEQLIEAMR